MPRAPSYVNSLQPLPVRRVHAFPIVTSWLSVTERPFPIALSLLSMTVMWSEPLTRTPSEPNLLMLSLSRTMKLEPSIRMPTEPPASPEFASTCEIVVCVWTFRIQTRTAPFGGAVVQLDCTQSMLKNLVTFPLELSTFSPYPGLRSFSWSFAIRYGSLAVPVPDTTPFAAVKSESCLMRMGPWGPGPQLATPAACGPIMSTKVDRAIRTPTPMIRTVRVLGHNTVRPRTSVNSLPPCGNAGLVFETARFLGEDSVKRPVRFPRLR